jgi:NADPH:quinone reductase-like Zn-dependent oxidoreductase
MDLDLGLLMRARATMVGTVLRPRPLEEKITASRAFARDALPLIAAGKLRPIVDTVLPLEAAREGHERLERNDSFGKIVLTP